MCQSCHEWIFNRCCGKADNIVYSEKLSDGEGDPDGIGCTRLFKDNNGDPFETIISIYSKPRLFGYHIYKETVITDHQGVTSFTPVEGGTEIIWFMSGNNNGYVEGENQREEMRKVMQQVMDDAASDLAKTCEALVK